MLGKNNIYRIIVDIILIISAFLLPNYVSVILIFVSVLIFNNFIESIIFGFILDMLYGSGRIFGYNFAYFFTLISVIFYVISFKIKEMVRVS